MTNQYSYELSLNILKALGGDMTVQYENTDQIWAAIDGIYAASGDGLDLQALVLNITENGTYDYNITDEVDAYVPVSISVNVQQKYTDEQVEDLKDTAREEGYTSGYDKGVADGYVQGESEGYTDGYAEGLEDGAEDQKALLEDITITDNGVYEKEDGYKKVTVEVPMPEIPTFETEELNVEITANGDYEYTTTADGYSKVNVSVEVSGSGGGDSKIDFQQIGYSTTLENIFYDKITSDLAYSKQLYDENYNKTSINFSYNSNIKYMPQLDFTKYTSISSFIQCKELEYVPVMDLVNAAPFNGSDYSGLFYNCPKLSYIEKLKLYKYKNFNSMFYGCSNLTNCNLEAINCNLTSATKMFYNCYKLKEVPFFDTSKCTSLQYMFYNCRSLVSVPNYDTSSITGSYGLAAMFYDCESLVNAPELNTGNYTSSMGNMFYNCNSLVYVPNYDTSNVTDTQSMFDNCESLVNAPELNTGKCTNIQSMYANCSKLTNVPEIDCSSVTSSNAFFNNSFNVVNFGGFKNLGMQSNLSSLQVTTISQCSKLSKESALNFVNKLYDRASAGYSVITIKLHKEVLALLSDEEKAVATNKGWTLTAS